MIHDLVIRAGRLVGEDGVADADVAVDGGRVTVVGSVEGGGRREIDAAGRIVTPGGVDTHVHLGQRSSRGDLTADDFWTGSRSAAHGGTTTVVPFAAQHRGMTLAEVMRDAWSRAEEQMAVDYGFHVIVTDPTIPGFDEDLAAAAAAGIVGIKLYLTYDRLRLDGGTALAAMEQAAELGLSVMVHAEDDAIVSWGRERAMRQGVTDASGHIRSHSPAAERAGVETAVALAETVHATLVLAHLSLPDSLDAVASARQRGVRVFAETCPHYVVMHDEALAGPIEETAEFMSSPPLRPRVVMEEMRRKLAAGSVDLVASDHSPYTAQQKLPQGQGTVFTEVANGVPGIAVRMPILMDLALSGTITLMDAVRLGATTPAVLAGFTPDKGLVAEGSDADLVVWEPGAHRITAAELHDAVGSTPYEGMIVGAWPATVVSRGEVIIGEEATLEPGRGHLLRRG